MSVKGSSKSIDGILDGGSNQNKWIDADGNINWPPNEGFAGEVSDITLKPCTLIDRYGYDGGSFVSPIGTSYTNRALAPGTDLKPYTIFEVVKPVEVKAGSIAPWFDELGGGLQYKFDMSIEELLKEGVLRIW